MRIRSLKTVLVVSWAFYWASQTKAGEPPTKNLEYFFENGAGSRKELLEGIRSRSPEHVRNAIASGAEADALISTEVDKDGEGLTFFIEAVIYAAAPAKPDPNSMQILEELLRAGARAAFPSKDGSTAIMFAQRCGSEQVTAFLQERGESIPSDDSVAIRARYTKIDAYLLLSVVDQYLVSGGDAFREIGFGDLEPLCPGLKWSIVRNKGRDPFGNSLIFSLRSDVKVGISKASAAQGASVVGPDFWFPFPIL